METTVDVTEHSQVAEVRRVVAELARKHGMPEIDKARAALVATEVATNMVKYAKRGIAAVSWFVEDGAEGIQIIGADHGPGFANFDVSARDGHSTSGSLGIGLGTLMRTANVFDHYSIAGAGAVIFTRVSVGGLASNPVHGKLVAGTRSVPKPGQTQCGDAWGYSQAGRWQRLCLVDGLGHGTLAASAAAEAVRMFKTCPESDSPSDIITKAHAALKSTRGAVMAVVAIDTQSGAAIFSGIGNITAGIFWLEQSQRLSSAPGIVGFNIQSVRQHDYHWTPGSTLIMTTDGLSTRWNLSKVPGLLGKHPALIAAAMHRDFVRGSDDSAVVVARELA
jgi:anti-sigma regulatory factor (Ser/Thr protein kinase)